MFHKFYSKTHPLTSSLLLKNNNIARNFYKSTINMSKCTSNKDNYGGLHMDVSSLPDDIEIENIVNDEVKKFNDLRTLWIELEDKHYNSLHRLSKMGFKVHHVRDEVLVLFKPLNSSSRIPKYAFTNIGVGAVVVNSRNEVLFVKEKHPYRKQMWKFPGGYVEQSEDLHKAIEREVHEETGIKAKFESILLWRHLHKFAFDCADMYFVCLLIAENDDIKQCDREIEFCQWSNIDQIKHELSPFNRHCLEQYLKYKQSPHPIVAQELDTPYLPIPKVTLYGPK